MPIHKQDYQNYQAEDGELYHHQRRQIKDARLDLFANKVFEDIEGKALELYVTDFYENESMTHVYSEWEGVDYPAYKKQVNEEMEQGNPDYWESEAERIQENREVIEQFSRLFTISGKNSLIEPAGHEKREGKINAFSGMIIHIPLGQGILNFCYTDFKAAFEKHSSLYSLLSVEGVAEIKKRMGREDTATQEVKHPIENKPAEIIYTFERYTDTFTLLSGGLYASLYTACFPPMFHTTSQKVLAQYCDYLCLLQEDIKEMIGFCFDEEFYPGILGKLHPAERYGFYCMLKGISPSIERSEVFSLSHNTGFGIDMPYGTTADEIRKRIQTKIDLNNEEYQAFLKQFSAQPAQVELAVRFPSFLNISYACSTLYEMLMLEFSKMLEHGIRFKKCKNCGRYFILKGNYKTDYCDRTPEGETKDCQTIASLKNYRARVAGNTAWLLYNKFYKRYHARMKAGNIDPDIFKKWQYSATSMRDDCTDGKLSEKDFQDWLHGSFPNRKQKE